jgi:hypothetical protein
MLERIVELRSRELAGSNEELSQPSRRPASHGEHDLAAAEMQNGLIVQLLGAHGEDTRFPGELQKLEHVLDSEFPKGSFDCHGV